MSSKFYLPRKLSSNANTFTEAELLAASAYVVVLAEPGGGKTELMESLAKQLGTALVTANAFRHRETNVKNCPLVIDAFDELAKIDNSGIYPLLANATKTNPTRIIISSRSSEWDYATTSAFKDCIGHQPLVVRLYEFNEVEQKAIFDHYAPGEDFHAFQSEVSRFDLEALIPNPQFLRLFADAYIESDRHFIDKRSIFSQAVERLAKEANTTVSRTTSTLTTSQKVELSSEVFVKLLLSGAEGVGTSEATEDRMYPFLTSLIGHGVIADGILATRLFKPGANVDKHQPVHKIITEYCAAAYLIKRTVAPSDPLTLHGCLSVIAPNATVRDELRGLLGWMATLGSKPIQQAAIKLDPYAVLANGDPSQLEHSSKRLLLMQLKDTESEDPYFRRGDYGRKFSVAGFFTQDVLEETRPLLAVGCKGSLRDLILELLAESQEAEQLQNELQQLVLASGEKEHTRILANRCLINVCGHSHRADLVALISEGTHASLKIAAESIEKRNYESFGREALSEFFRACADLYPSRKQRLEDIVGQRYFVRSFIAGLDLPIITWLLDELTKDLTCQCGKNPYECDCRNGISKIVGLLLDRYFELVVSPQDPKRILQWVENLHFHEYKTAEYSKAVKALQEDSNLRQSIFALVLGKLTDREKIFEAKRRLFVGHNHSGLSFQADDYTFLVDLAFEAENHELWASFISGHDYYRAVENRGPDILRRHMRQQALLKPSFIREWAKSNIEIEQSRKKYQVHDARHARWQRRLSKKKIACLRKILSMFRKIAS